MHINILKHISKKSKGAMISEIIILYVIGENHSSNEKQKSQIRHILHPYGKTSCKHDHRHPDAALLTLNCSYLKN